MLCCSHFSSLDCEELWFQTGVRDKSRYIPVHSVSQAIGSSLCSSLPGFHALTGCDSTSSFYGIGKKKAWNVIEKNSEFQAALGQLGQAIPLSKRLQNAYEKIVCRFYTSAPKSGTTVNSVRHWLFCQKPYTNENLPPTHDSLNMHIKRANFQSMVWTRCLQPKQNLPAVSGNGWDVNGMDIQTVLMTKEPAPKGLIELTACNCKKSACGTRACTCRQNDLACTEFCACMADESCQNTENMPDIDEDEV